MVWHGNVDILLGPHPDVAVHTKVQFLEFKIN